MAAIDMTTPPTQPVPAATAALTRQIADYACDIAGQQPSDRALAVVRLGFTDAAAVTLAGLSQDVTRITRRLVRADPGRPQARLCFSAERASPAQAALLGAVAAHAIDWDDYAYSNHPSAVLVPTILAVADAHGATGMRMAQAYVAGYEVWGNLMRREPGHLHSKGWHPTAVLGPVAAAVAAAVLMRLDRTMARHAVALSASFAGGVMANFGTMAKPLHAGRAAQSGIQAATMAQAGIEAGNTALESPLGLLRALSPEGRVDLHTPLPGVAQPGLIETLGLNIKKYPTVGASQRTIDALRGLLARQAVDPAQVHEAIALVGEKHAAVMPFHHARTALEAKFSLEFVVAACLLRGKVGIAELQDDFVASDAVQALMQRVRIETTAEVDPHYPGAAPADFVRLRMADGTELSTDKVRRATGHADLPLPTAELWAKFQECAQLVQASEPRARRLFDALQHIDTLSGPEDIPEIA
jgi:aconitate decarboxylase